MRFTFTTETLPDREGVWLCIDNSQTLIPLARFESEDAVRCFNEALALARSVSHAQGQLGI